MGFLLDTNTISAHPRGHRRVVQKTHQNGGRLFLSAVAMAEVLAWPRVPASPAVRRDLELLLTALHLLPLDEPIARRFGDVSRALRAAGPRCRRRTCSSPPPPSSTG